MTLAPEIVVKEPDAVRDVSFDLSRCSSLPAGTTLTAVESQSASPAEERHRLSFSVLEGEFRLGESVAIADQVVGNVVQVDTDAVDLYVPVGRAISIGDVLTGAVSGASCTVAEALGASTKQADGVQIDSASATGQRVVVRLSGGLRPLPGSHERESIVRLLVVASDGQRVAVSGRLHILEEQEAAN